MSFHPKRVTCRHVPLYDCFMLISCYCGMNVLNSYILTLFDQSNSRGTNIRIKNTLSNTFSIIYLLMNIPNKNIIFFCSPSSP